MPLLREKKEAPLRGPKKAPVFFDKVQGVWVRFHQRKRRPSKAMREFKREFHNAFEYFKDEIKAGLG